MIWKFHLFCFVCSECVRSDLENSFIFVIFITRTKIKIHRMKDPNKITELNKWLSDLPTVVRYKYGEEMTDCRLVFFFNKVTEQQWTAGYYSGEFDYFVMCGYGNTIVEAVGHLRKLYKDARKRRVDGVVEQ